MVSGEPRLLPWTGPNENPNPTPSPCRGVSEKARMGNCGIWGDHMERLNFHSSPSSNEVPYSSPLGRCRWTPNESQDFLNRSGSLIQNHRDHKETAQYCPSAKRKELSTRILYLVKISFENDSQIKQRDPPCEQAKEIT